MVSVVQAEDAVAAPGVCSCIHLNTQDLEQTTLIIDNRLDHYGTQRSSP
jgi:hypothetical protein